MDVPSGSASRRRLRPDPIVATVERADTDTRIDHLEGQRLDEVLATRSLSGATVLAGSAGLHRTVERLNVMEVPDILPWVKPHEFLLTTGYPLRGRPETLPQLVTDLADAGLTGIGVKLGRYLDDLPPGMIEVANARGFPIVRLPDDVGFDEILNEVLTGILNRQAAALARSERIHRAFLQLVLRGHGLPEIVRDLADLVASPAVIAAPDGRILASSRLDELCCDAPETLAVRGDGTVGVGDHDHAAVTVAITAGTRQHGHVVAFAGTSGLTADTRALENAATVAALAMTKQLEVQAVEDKYRSDLMHDLLRHVDDVHDVRRRAAGFGWDLDRRLVAVVLRLDEAPTSPLPDEVAHHPPLAATVQRAVLDHDPGAAVVRFGHEVVVLTGAFDVPDGRVRARDAVQQLVSDAVRAVGGSVSAGVSRPAADLHEVAGAYEQAGRALTIGRDVHGPGAVVHFDDLGAYRVLSLVEDRTELQAFAAEILGELVDESASADDLRRTLEVLLECGGNVAEASRRLHFHYNTLRYRVDKLESLVGPFTTDARTRLDVQLALLVHSMKGLDARP